MLTAGNYHVEWTAGSGPTEVSFLKGKDVVAKAPAQVVNKKTVYPGAIETRREPDKSSLLEAIDLKNMSLHFPKSATNPTSTSPRTKGSTS